MYVGMYLFHVKMYDTLQENLPCLLNFIGISYIFHISFSGTIITRNENIKGRYVDFRH